MPSVGQRLDEMDEDAGPLDVPQELVAEAGAGVRPFDEARNVGHHELPVAIDVDDAEVGVLGGEGIVGDLRAGARQAGEERAFAGVGLADQADVGDDFQLQEQLAAFAFAAGRGIARGAVGGAFEMGVASAAVAAAGGDDGVAVLRQILESEAAFGVDDERAGRDFDDQVVGAFALLVCAAAGRAVVGAPEAVMGEGGEVVDAVFGDDDHAAAIAAVAAVGAAVRDIFFAPKADAAVAAAASLDFDGDAIDEHEWPEADIRLRKGRSRGAENVP